MTERTTIRMKGCTGQKQYCHKPDKPDRTSHDVFLPIGFNLRTTSGITPVALNGFLETDQSKQDCADAKNGLLLSL
jgi:hypothetical protein